MAIFFPVTDKVTCSFKNCPPSVSNLSKLIIWWMWAISHSGPILEWIPAGFSQHRLNAHLILMLGIVVIISVLPNYQRLLRAAIEWPHHTALLPVYMYIVLILCIPSISTVCTWLERCALHVLFLIQHIIICSCPLTFWAVQDCS